MGKALGIHAMDRADTGKSHGDAVGHWPRRLKEAVGSQLCWASGPEGRLAHFCQDEDASILSSPCWEQRAFGLSGLIYKTPHTPTATVSSWLLVGRALLAESVD